MKNGRARVLTRFSPLQPYGSYLLPWKPDFWSNLAQKLMQPIPHPNDDLDEIWLWLVSWSQINIFYQCKQQKDVFLMVQMFILQVM